MSTPALLPLPAFDDNYIWSLDDGACGRIVVDPGDAAPVIAAVEAGQPLRAVLITHHHHDHIGGVAALRARWPALPVYAPHDPRIADATRRVGDGDLLQLGAWTLEVLAVPAHTRSHIAYLARRTATGHDAAPLLFCGDTLFHLGCGRLFEGTPAQLQMALARFAALPDATAVCCTHEYTLSNARFALAVDPDNHDLQRAVAEARALRDAGQPSLPTRIDVQRAANPFLRCATPAIRAAVEAQAGRTLDTPLEVLAELRRWKDVFR
jgi:hydroxyacylglutathione hydrolase